MFEAVRILDIDIDRTMESEEKNPSVDAQFDIFIKLSRAPEPEWIAGFGSPQGRIESHLSRQIGFHDDFLVIRCPLGEVPHHVPLFFAEVNEANEKRLAAIKEQERKKAEKKKHLNELRDTLEKVRKEAGF